MIVLFHLSILAAMIFLYVGIYGLRLNMDSKINKTFFICCLSTAIWSFGAGFTYITSGHLKNFFFAISALGWCYESAIFLHMTLLLTDNKLINNKAIIFLLYSPGTLFYYLSIFVIRLNKQWSGFAFNFFNYGDTLYDIVFSFITLTIILIWTIKAKEKSQAIQGRIIFITGFVTYVLNSLNQGVLPMLACKAIPSVGHLINLILIIGVYFAIIRYKLLRMDDRKVINDILYEMLDIVIIVSETGKILFVNRSACDLTGYTLNELTGNNLDLLIRDKDFTSYIIKNGNDKEAKRYTKIWISSKSGKLIPIDLSCRHVMDSINKEKAGAVIVGHDLRENVKLQAE